MAITQALGTHEEQDEARRPQAHTGLGSPGGEAGSQRSSEDFTFHRAVMPGGDTWGTTVMPFFLKS